MAPRFDAAATTILRSMPERVEHLLGTRRRSRRRL